MSTDAPALEVIAGQALEQYRLSDVNFNVSSLGRGQLFCEVILRRAYNKALPVIGRGGDLIAALDDAKKRLEKVNKIESDLGRNIYPPKSEDQPYENGYFRGFLYDDVEVEFKRKGGKFVITAINRRDENGFCYAETPYPVPPDLKFKQKLDDGFELWTWDDIGILSGSAGEVVVKDGMVIKSKMTHMA